jgi:hypothetical protein
MQTNKMDMPILVAIWGETLQFEIKEAVHGSHANLSRENM